MSGATSVNANSCNPGLTSTAAPFVETRFYKPLLGVVRIYIGISSACGYRTRVEWWEYIDGTGFTLARTLGPAFYGNAQGFHPDSIFLSYVNVEHVQ
jgi:hypothetical protein